MTNVPNLNVANTEPEMGERQRDAYFARRAEGTLPRYHQPRFGDVYHDGEWEGEDVWVIGGGPSVGTHDLSRLTDRKIIAINMGFTVVGATIVYIGSVNLLSRLQARNQLGQITCHKATLEAMVWNTAASFGCHVLEVADQDAEWGSIRNGLPVFTNSGLVAVNLADALGARRIFLIGFDMAGGPDGRTENFHADYPASMRPPADRYDVYLSDFLRVPEFCRAEVLNCSPDSRLALFPHCSFEDSML